MSKMRLNGYQNTSLAVPCPACGDLHERPLAWLHAADQLDCESCGRTIEIATGPIRLEIDRLLERCVLTDAQFAGD